MKTLFVNRNFIVYPLLFAVFPILFLYAHNASETSVNQIWLPMAISVSSTLLLWILLSVILKSVVKAGLSTSILLLFFFSYGHVYGLLERWDVFVPKHSIWLLGMLLVWGYCTYFIKISNKQFKGTTKALNIMAVVLIAINLFNIAAYQIRLATLVTGDLYTKESDLVKPSELGKLPDIYYIILDEYAHPDTMAEYYNYDNSQFIDNLTGKGFFVASKSRTKEKETYRSLATSLSMEYISDTAAKEVVYQQLNTNKVMSYLKSKGYNTIYFSTPYDDGRYKIPADTQFDFYESIEHDTFTTEFGTILWKTTMLRPFYNVLKGSQSENTFRRGVIDTLDYLKEIPNIEGPKFVFVHFMCPHEPFILGPRGEFVDSANWFNYKDKQYYLGQYVFITLEIERVIDALLEKSVDPPIIILQSDHGIRPHPGSNISEKEWENILNAYYLPHNGNAQLWDSISPVNSFRVVFNQYFGTDYKFMKE